MSSAYLPTRFMGYTYSPKERGPTFMQIVTAERKAKLLWDTWMRHLSHFQFYTLDDGLDGIVPPMEVTEDFTAADLAALNGENHE